MQNGLMAPLGIVLVASALTSCSPNPTDIARFTQMRVQALQELRNPKNGSTPLPWCNTAFVSKASGFKNPLRIHSVSNIDINSITWWVSFSLITQAATAIAPTDPNTQTIRYEFYPRGFADEQYSPLSPGTMKCHPDSYTK